jgi:hypothetical protein
MQCPAHAADDLAQEPATDEPAPGPATDDGWSFLAVPYLWLPEIHGSVQIRQLSVPVDVDFSKVFELLGHGDLFAGMGHFEADYDRLALMVDSVGGTIRPSQTGARGSTDLTLNFFWVEFGPAYTLLRVPTPLHRPITLDGLCGGRFMYFYNSIDFQGNAGRLEVKNIATTSWVDPFVGGRFSVPLADQLELFFRGDIGGFGAGSQLVWNLVGGFQYHLPWHPGGTDTAVYAAYKAFDFDYETGPTNKRVVLDLNLRGPGFGLGFRF